MRMIPKLPFTGFKTLIRMSLRDYLHERLLSICAILGLAAVLAPLLVLFGVKSGIINTMAERLIENPKNREIVPVGSGRFDEDWFQKVSQLSTVAFIIPQTRTIAANMVLVNRVGSAAQSVVVDLVPTGDGDPLLEKWAAVPDTALTIVLSASAARKLGVVKGSVVSGTIGRSMEGRKERVSVQLTVAAILPLAAHQLDSAFVRLKLLTATEDYRDGFGSPSFDWPGKGRPTGGRNYPGFRLYARSIYDVPELRDQFIDQGMEVYTKAEEIEVVKSLERAFSLIFRLIAVVAVLGYFASMTSSVLANVNRKSRHLGVTRLIGFSTSSIIWFPIFQALLTAVLGNLTALVLYQVVEKSINHLFGAYLAQGEYVCRLSVIHMLFSLLLTMAIAVLASAYAAYRTASIEPSQVIRDV
jgi:putative ABC transport system permease protein